MHGIARHSYARRRKGERGQTLLFGLIAMVVLVVAIFVIFDLHTVIRFKVKAQTAVDAAALTAAKWQKDSLNLIGEINLVKACTVLISDGTFGIGGDPDTYVDKDSKSWDVLNAAGGPLDQLAAAYGILTQMQTRISFVGPMVGIGAAQQAAKNNGLDYSANYSNGAVWAYKNLRDSYDADHGLSMIYPPNFSWGYDWKAPYQSMMADLVWNNPSADGNGQSYAFAVNVNKKMATPLAYFDPSTPYINPDPFNRPSFYVSCLATNSENPNSGWCFLADFRNSTFEDMWWKRLKVRLNWSFPYEAEYCPLQINFSSGSQTLTDAKGVSHDAPSFYIDGSGRSLEAFASVSDAYDPYATVSGSYRRDPNDRYVRPEFDPAVRGYNPAKVPFEDGKFSAYGSLPLFAWCVYDTANDKSTTSADGSTTVTWKRWDTCTDAGKSYLYGYDETMRGPSEQKIKSEYSYKSGAFAFMGATFPDSGQRMWLGNMKLKSSNGSETNVLNPDDSAYRDAVLKYDRYQGTYTTQIKSQLSKLDNAEKSYLQFAGQRSGGDLFLNTSDKYVATSVAKPMGRIPVKGSGGGVSSEYLKPCATGMILPVFETACLVPKFFPDYTFSGQSPPNTDFFSNPDFYNFLLYCIPELQDESITSVETLLANMPNIMAAKHPEIWNANVRRYFEALAVFIQMTKDWEEIYKPWIDANWNTTCNTWGGHGPGTRYGPAVP